MFNSSYYSGLIHANSHITVIVFPINSNRFLSSDDVSGQAFQTVPDKCKNWQRLMNLSFKLAVHL